MTSMKFNMLLGFVLVIGLATMGEGRALPGRALQQAPASGTVVSVSQGQSPFNLTVFNIGSSSQCVIQSHPGSRADSVVPGPLTFSIPSSIVAIRTYYATTNAAIVVYNNTRDVVVGNATATGLTLADYYKDSTPTSNGSLTGGLILNYNPSDPAHNAASTPACYVTVNFVTAPLAPAPAPVQHATLVLPTASG